LTPLGNEDLVSGYLAVYNALDMEGLMAEIHPRIEFSNISGGVENAAASGRGAFRRLAELSLDLCASCRQTWLAYRESGDVAHAAVAFEAVLAADLPNGMRAGDNLSLRGHTEFGFGDG
jgi:hypothetical protein